MIGYILIIIITTLIALVYQKTKSKIVFLLLVIFPSFFCGFRGVGTDYYVYLRRFHDINNGIMFSSLGTDLSGPFYKFFQIINHIFGNYQVAICIISFITIFIAFYLICQHSSDISVSFAIFSYMTIFYFLSFNIFRQCLAAEVYALGVYLFIKNKKNIVAIIVLALSVIIHSSIMPFILLIPFIPWICNNSKLKSRICIYIVLFTIILLLPELSAFTNKIFKAFPHYAFYFLNFNYQGFGLGVFRYLFLVCTIILILHRFGCLSEKKYVVYSFLSLIGAILTWLSYVSNTFIYRIGYIGLVFLPILHGYYVKRFIAVTCKNGALQIRYSNTAKGKIASIFSLALLFLLLFFFLYDYVFLNTGDILPYSMCFNVN